MFIELGRQFPQLRRSDMCWMSLLRSWKIYCVTRSINIPRLWRYRIREFASSIPSARTPKAPPIYVQASVNWDLNIQIHRAK
jgi:hypothetical protein